MRKKKLDEETYSLTPKGALYLAITDSGLLSEELAQRWADKMIDTLELTARRQSNNAIILTKGDPKFVLVEELND